MKIGVGLRMAGPSHVGLAWRTVVHDFAARYSFLGDATPCPGTFSSTAFAPHVADQADLLRRDRGGLGGLPGLAGRGAVDGPRGGLARQFLMGPGVRSPGWRGHRRRPEPPCGRGQRPVRPAIETTRTRT